MKYLAKRLCLMVALATFIGPLDSFAGEQGKNARLAPLLESSKAFSFRTGQLVEINGPKDFLHADLFFDPPNLLVNNDEHYRPFQGKGGIIDLGKKQLNQVNELPKTGYSTFLSGEQLKVGHCYGILTADGRRYVLIHVNRVNLHHKQGVIEFAWEFRPK